MASILPSAGANDASVINSTYNSKNGRYVLGGTTEVSASAIEWWEKNAMLPDPSDFIYVMEKKYEGRPDILGYVFYGDPLFWWVICQYNAILDPFAELVEGKVLLIPQQQRITQTSSTSVGTTVGGVLSTRIY
jgi:hypothetical protein